MSPLESECEGGDSEESAEGAFENWKPVRIEEWNFDSIPNEDLIPCCIWEYARESRTIALASADRWNSVREIWFRKQYAEDPTLRRKHDEQAEINRSQIEAAEFNYEEFSYRLWQTDCPLIGIFDAVIDYAQDGVLPWQMLPESFCNHLREKLNEKSILQPFRSSNIEEVERLWEQCSVELKSIRATPNYEESDNEMFELLEETLPIEFTDNEDVRDRAVTVAAFTIDFSRFADSEIQECFRQWLLANRPSRYATPSSMFPKAKRKGKKELEYRVALERLGLMRLLHYHTPADIERTVPDAWCKFGAKKDSFRREVRAACEFFQNLFPFLPEDEMPTSHQRFSTWNTPLQKYLDALDEEYFGSGDKKS